MNAMLQTVLVMVLFISALVYLGRRAWRAIAAARRKSSGGCGPDCGCG